MSIERPSFEDLEPDFQKILQPNQPKLLMMLAKGVAPLPAQKLIPAWCYLLHVEDEDLKAAAKNSLQQHPLSGLVGVAKLEIPYWALYDLGKELSDKEEVLEAVLLNRHTPSELFLEVASQCSEKIAQIITNNQERIIDRPEIVVELEKNPQSLKSNTERLRQFLRLAGVFIPGDQELALQKELEKAEEGSESIEELIDAQELTEEKRINLQQYITTLSIGAKVKLGIKGNKEARKLLVKDTNKTVATSVLKSPKVNENEIIFYSSLKNVSEDVIREIARNPSWTKNYSVKLNLINHPKTPLEKSMAFIKFLNLRDLQGVTRSKTIPPPLRKSASELLKAKRR